LPNASVGIDRLRALLRRPRSRLSATALRFHRQAIRGAASLRLHLVGRPLEPQPTVAVISLARPAGVDARAGLAVARPTSPEAAPTSPEPASWSPTGTPPSHQPALLADGRLGRRSAPRLRPAGGTGPDRPRGRRSTALAQLTEFRGGTPRRMIARVLRDVGRRAVAHEHAAAAAVAAVLVGASFASAVPSFAGPPSGNADGPGTTPRIVVGGGVLGPPPTDGLGGDEIRGPEGWTDEPFDDFGSNGGRGGAVDGGPTDGGGPGQEADPQARLADPEASAETIEPVGPFLADGTLLKPVAVDTRVPDARDRLVFYRVQSGDTLTGIARRFGISMMTLWWANELTSKDDLHVGQVLRIPPVDGLVVTVADGDTLDAIAARTGVPKETIAAFNGLTDDGLVVGQTLIVPGARGDPIPTPKPTPRPVLRTVTRTVQPPSRYTGGALLWPVAGGYLSQYYHYGHYGIDIAADYGTPVRAAAAGTVVFAGWKSNGGGYQVWIAHGSGLYTGYYHMSAVSVGRGQAVGRGQMVGRIGTSGWATGPHLHFEVWRGYPWEAGSSRVNPLRYL
jgi:murein DD-endopeptidase MepM/ murein hydrolase activator NlpD